MKTVSTMALALALGLGGALAVAPVQAAKKDAAPAPAKANYSPKIVANDKPIRAAIEAKDWAKAKPLAEASEAEIKTDDDKQVVGGYFISIGQNSSDQAMLAKGIDLTLASGKVGPDVQSKLYAARGTMAYQAKDYDKSISALTEAKRLNSDDPNLIPILVEAQSQRGQTLQALQTLNEGIDSYVAAGKPVPKEWFPRGFTIAYAVKQTDPNFAAVRSQASALDRKWVKADPSGTVWHDVLLLYSESNRGDAELANDVRRLLFLTGGLKTANDYLEYAEATYQKYPGEAKTVLDDGVKKGVYTFASNKNAGEINGIVSPKVAADKASLAGSEKAAGTAANGRVALSVADAYLGYNNFPKAIEFYKLAMTKGGIDANIIHTRLGIAMVRSGDKAGAKAEFAQVTGPRKELADFWTVYADQPPTAA